MHAFQHSRHMRPPLAWEETDQGALSAQLQQVHAAQTQGEQMQAERFEPKTMVSLKSPS